MAEPLSPAAAVQQQLSKAESDLRDTARRLIRSNEPVAAMTVLADADRVHRALVAETINKKPAGLP